MSTFTGITQDGKKLETIEIDRYIQQENNRYVAKIAGQLTYKEIFDKLKAHLEYVGMLPDEYFKLSPLINANEQIPKDWISFQAETVFGSSEGIYIDIVLHTDNANKVLASGKTLEDDTEAFLRMSRIAAECNLMLNGNGALYRLPKDVQNILQNKHTELSDTESKLVHAGLVNGENDEVHIKSTEIKRSIVHHNELEDEDLVEDDQWDL